MDNQTNNIENNDTKKHLSKAQDFVGNTKKAVRKVLTTAGIAANSLYPASINTTSTSIISSPVIKVVTLGTAANLLSACIENGIIGIDDTTPPTIDILKSEVDITGGKEIQIIGNNLYIGGVIVASWSDDTTKDCRVLIFVNGVGVSSGDIIENEGTLSVKVFDGAGNVQTQNIKLNMVKNAPSINVNKAEVNIFGGDTISVDGNQLMVGNEVVASWTDDDLESCTVALKFNGQKIKSGDMVDNTGILSLAITNKSGKSSYAEIVLKNDAVSGIENLKNTAFQVDREVNLLNGITFANGVELVKTEIEIDGKKSEISDPSNYIPEYPGTMNIIFTIEGKNGDILDVNVDNLTINPIEYKSMEINNLEPSEILPIIGQVEWGDGYKPIEHLRIAESTKMRDMMRKYGAGNHTPEEYQQLMSRLHTGMLNEFPYDYDNYEKIGNFDGREPSKHAYEEWGILNTLVDHAKFQISDDWHDLHDLGELINNNPNNIYIFGNSSFSFYAPDIYDLINKDGTGERLRDARDSKNFIMRIAGSNIENQNGKTINKILNRDIPPTQEGIAYGDLSRANSKGNIHPERHIMVTIATNSKGNVNQTNESGGFSKFPIGFNDNVLFAGRTFPYQDYQSGRVGTDGYKYPTSYANYLNVAVTDLCFQMFAEIKDVDELLEMIRSTSLRDYISLDGETQALQLINPAGFIQKYLMPAELPTQIKPGETVSLNKGYYKGIIFDIPGAEVNINGEWVAYNDENKALIKNQNPFELEWRINGDLCKKMGYESKDIQGKIIMVDDKRNGLNISKNYYVSAQ